MSHRTFASLLDSFIESASARGCEPATVKCYRYFADRFLVPALGGRWLTTLRPSDFERLYRRMSEHGYVPSTLRKCNTTAGAALKLAERREWITSNPARLAELPRNVKPNRFIPTPEDVRVFLACALEKDRDIHDYAWTMANTGIRPGEACGLQKDDLADGVLTIQRSIDVCQGSARVKGTKTGNTRRLTLDPKTITVLLTRDGRWVFGGDYPPRTDLFSKRFKRVARRCDSLMVPRCLRHFHATQLLASGMPPKAVADRLGHANPLMTLSVYAGHVPALDEKAAEVIAAVMAA